MRALTARSMCCLVDFAGWAVLIGLLGLEEEESTGAIAAAWSVALERKDWTATWSVRLRG